MKPILFLCLISPILLSSCALFTPNHPTTLPKSTPEKFSLYSDAIPDTTNRWWETFQSSELNALIDEALTNSPSIEQAWARLAQAEAVASKTGANRKPSVTYEARESKSHNSISKRTLKTYELGLNASYELDLWGRVKSNAEAAALDHQASREQLNTSAITLTSQIALSWCNIISSRQQTELLRQQLETNKTSLELVELRFQKSQANALDVFQQRQNVAATEARLPTAERQEILQQHALAALLGRSNLSINPTTPTLPEIGPLPIIGFPADILANRPDVRRAGLALKSAEWSVSAARADRLPAIRLTASADYRNSNLSDLFDDWYANLAAGITGPIFESGRRKAEVKRTRALANERLAAYRETVINAIVEVEDALASEQKQHEYISALDRNLEASRNAYSEALNRYRNGLSEYLPVLIQLTNLQNIERERVSAQYDLLRYRINLYRALGGTWANELPKPSFNRKD